MIALIDLGYLFRRNWHATEYGEVSEASKRTLEYIHKISNDHDHVGICIDRPPYERSKKYPEYKANRPETDGHMIGQLTEVITRLKEEGYAIFGREGFEADDMIASVAAELYEEQIMVYSGDKDLLQLVDGRVQVTSPATDVVMSSTADVVDRFGVPPKDIPMFLALCGDKSDNIPGIKGIGPKKAAQLIAGGAPIDSLDLTAEQAGNLGVWKGLATLARLRVDCSALKQPRTPKGKKPPEPSEGRTEEATRCFSPPQENHAIPLASRREIYMMLSRPFPKEAIERTSKQDTRKAYDTTGIKYQYVVNRLNEVLGVGCFRTERTFSLTPRTARSGRPMVEATCDVKMQLGLWGNGEWTPFAEAVGTGGHVSDNEADAKKGSYTNGFKKVAAMFGVGRQAYEGTIDDDNVPQEIEPARSR